MDDPDAALTAALDLARELVDDPNATPEAIELAGKLLGLHEWLRRGGPLPAAWAAAGRSTD